MVRGYHSHAAMVHSLGSPSSPSSLHSSGPHPSHLNVSSAHTQHYHTAPTTRTVAPSHASLHTGTTASTAAYGVGRGMG